jgi:hypothetical protein
MKPGAPWNTKGLRFDALETAREAERRSDRFAARPSMVNSADLPPRRRYETSEGFDWDRQLYPRHQATEEGRNWGLDQRHSLGRGELGRSEERQPRTDTIDGVNRRLDGLTRQLDQLARLNSITGSSVQRRSTQDDEGLRRLATAIARLDQRLDQMISEGRRAISDIERRVSAFDRTLGSLRREGPRRSPPDLPFGPEQTVSELVSHPPAQESEAATPSMSRLPEAPHYTGASDGQQLSGLQKQIEQLTSRMDGVAFLPDRGSERADAARRGTSQQDSVPQRVTGFGSLDALRK